MKLTTIFAILGVLISVQPVVAQASFNLEEDKGSDFNGIEFSYVITNERNEKDYSRYEVTLQARNVSGCPIIYFSKADEWVTSIFEGDPSAIARFDCTNATGRRLTSKGGMVKARPFYVPYQQPGKNDKGETIYTNVNVQGGYLLRPGESISNNIIIITEKGQRPKFKVRPKQFSELAN